MEAESNAEEAGSARAGAPPRGPRAAPGAGEGARGGRAAPRPRSQVLALLLLALLSALAAPAGGRAEGPVPVHAFWREGCPHCEGALEALRRIEAEGAGIRLDAVELGRDEAADMLFLKALMLFEVGSPAVPFVVIGDRHALGFSGTGATEALYRELIARCRAAPCRDVVAELSRLSDIATGRAAPAAEAAPPAPVGLRRVTLPLLGEIDLATLSFPAVTVVLAGIDGFNPCAMWVLVLLIGILLGIRDRGRVWALGLTFLLVTAAMYFAIMAAWLNMVLWIGAAGWLRVGIGFLAVAAGLHYLRDYWTNPGGVCPVTSGASRSRIGAAFRRVVEEPSLPLAMAGIGALAVAVNLVELVCSAGVPAVFTQLLALQDLSPAAHYGYLGLYIAVFLLDDAAILLTAMLTLRTAAAGGGYARISHAIGGGVLLALGAVMVLRPDWVG